MNQEHARGSAGVGRRLRSDRGDVSVTVLMVPFIILATMLVVQFGLAMWASQIMTGAAQDGAATAALDGSSTSAGLAVTDQLVSYSGGHLIKSQPASASTTATTVTITVQAEVESLIPFLSNFTVTGTSSATLERFRVPQP